MDGIASTYEALGTIEGELEALKWAVMDVGDILAEAKENPAEAWYRCSAFMRRVAREALEEAPVPGEVWPGLPHEVAAAYVAAWAPTYRAHAFAAMEKIHDAMRDIRWGHTDSACAELEELRAGFSARIEELKAERARR